MVGVLEGEPEDEDGDGHDRRRKPNDNEAGFGLDEPGMPARVVGADGVVEPVAQDGAEEGADNWGEVEEAWWDDWGKHFVIPSDSARAGEEKGKWTYRGCRG